MRHTHALLFALMLPALSVLGCGSSSAGSSAEEAATGFDLAAVRAEIEARNQQFTAAHVVGSLDSAAMVNIFTSDARILPPNSDPVVGRPAIEALTSLYMTMGITDFREETVQIYGNHEMLVDEGTYIFTYGPGRTTEKGKYVNIWRKEGGEWKIYSNMWNANSPAPGS